MEYIPGIGDYMAKYLPQLGANLQQIVKPELTAERALWETIVKDPSKINEYIEMERTNPGSTGIFGKDTQQELASRDFTEPYKTEKAQKQANLKFTEGGVKRQEQEHKKGEIELGEMEKFADIFNVLPEGTVRDLYFKQNLGMTEEQYGLLKDEMPKIMERRKIAEKYKGMNPNELLDSLYNDSKNFDLQTAQAVIESNPEGMRYALSLYGDKKSDELRKWLEGQQDRSGSDALLRSLLAGAIGEARETGISASPFAVLQSWLPGMDINKFAGGYGVQVNPAEVELVNNQRAAQAQAQKIQRAQAAIGRVTTVMKDIEGGKFGSDGEGIGYASLNGELQLIADAFGVPPIKIEMANLRFRPDKPKFFDAQGKELNKREVMQWLNSAAVGQLTPFGAAR